MGRSRAIAVLLLLLATTGVAFAGREGRAPVGPKKIVILLGYPGSGKGELSKILGRRVTRAKGWVSSDIIHEEARRRGLQEIPANLSLVGRELQAAEPGVVGKRIAAKIMQSRARRHVIDGLRTVDDVEAVRKLFPHAVLVKVHVPTDLRHQRMLLRGRLGETSLEVLQARDAADDKLGVGRLMAMDPEKSFWLTPGEGLESLSRTADPVVKWLRD